MKRISLFKIAIVSQILFTGLLAASYASDASLSADLIQKIQLSFKMDEHNKAMQNSITNNDIRKLAINRQILQSHNEIFSNKIKTKGITNQKQSGRCWLFAGLNILRQPIIKKYKLEKFEFSPNYLTFWDKMEKANTFLERIIDFAGRDIMDRELVFILRDPITDGGYWENVVNLIDKYGVVPKEVMPETNSSENTALMNELIARTLRADAVKLRKMHQAEKSVEQMREEKEKMLADIYKMLAVNLGQPPKEFVWRYEDVNSVVSEPNVCSPLSFYKDIVGIDLKEYVDIANDPSKEYGRYYEVDFTKNLYDGDNLRFVNIDIKTLRDITLKSVLDNQPVWFGADVGKDQDKDSGIMAKGLYDFNSIYCIDMELSKADRSLYRESSPTHAMVFTGVDVADGKAVKWLVENSWGDDKGSKGFWTMYDGWFDLNVYSCIVNKKYVPEDVLKIFEQKPVVRPPWDPMFSLARYK
jgi:bleomycin hydrolase